MTESEIRKIGNGSLYGLYPRTRLPFSLDEVLYIIDSFNKDVHIQDIAMKVKRMPSFLRWMFLEYRPKRLDGTYDPTKSVKTSKEVEKFDFQKHNIEKWDLVYEKNEIGKFTEEIEKRIRREKL